MNVKYGHIQNNGFSQPANLINAPCSKDILLISNYVCTFFRFHEYAGQRM